MDLIKRANLIRRAVAAAWRDMGGEEVPDVMDTAVLMLDYIYVVVRMSTGVVVYRYIEQRDRLKKIKRHSQELREYLNETEKD